MSEKNDVSADRSLSNWWATTGQRFQRLTSTMHFAFFFFFFFLGGGGGVQEKTFTGCHNAGNVGVCEKRRLSSHAQLYSGEINLECVQSLHRYSYFVLYEK